ncbi:MAG: STAS domain-containing protein [Fibrobacter sp.]|nr:STAS domain-containing protein [Fibrobacter sp.]
MKVSEIKRTLQNQFSGFVPEFFKMMRSGYRRADFTKDLMSGTIVGIVALPLAVAFAIASGVGPEKGLYTAIIAGFLISLLGGSRFQIGGPTGAFVVIVFGIVSEYGYDGLATATLMAGVMLVIFGFLKLGGIIKFIPFPVTVGFTMGIAIIIALGQIPNFLGFTFPDSVKEPAGALEKIWFYGKFLHTINPYAILVGFAAFLICLFWPKWNAKIPGSLVAILVTTLLVKLFHLDSVYGVATIGSEYQIPVGIPKPAMPQISLELMRKLFQPAISIALLGAIESLLSAVVADGMTGKKHRSNTELVAQGVANIFSPVFGGIPATGAIARTATNVRNGAVSPVSGMIHAAVLLLIMLFFGKYAEMIPLPTLAAVLFIVAFNMSDYKMFFKIFKSPKSDVIVLVSTFLLTILIDLTVAIQVGVLTAAVLFIKRMSEVSGIEVTKTIRYDDRKGADHHNLSAEEIPTGVVVYEIAGSLFFGAVDKFRMTLERIEGHPKILILQMRQILSIDAAGIKMIEDLLLQSRRNGTELILSGVHAQPVLALKRSGVLTDLGEENALGNIDASLNRAREILGMPLVDIKDSDFVPSVSWERHREKPWLPENANGIVAEESPEVIVESITEKLSAVKCGDEENRDVPK